jgi:hypothetical protein
MNSTNRNFLNKSQYRCPHRKISQKPLNRDMTKVKVAFFQFFEQLSACSTTGSLHIQTALVCGLLNNAVSNSTKHSQVV